MDLKQIKESVAKYNAILSTTKNYRKDWCDTIQDMISDKLNLIIKETGLNGFVELKDDIENLEVVTLSLGTEVSGIAEKLPGNKSKRPFIKTNGALIFQQLFNGKVMIMIMFPYIEGYGQPKPPKNVEIVRPEELKPETIMDYVGTFLQEVIEWEDFDDDLPEAMGFNPIGFGPGVDAMMDGAEQG